MNHFAWGNVAARRSRCLASVGEGSASAEDDQPGAGRPLEGLGLGLQRRGRRGPVRGFGPVHRDAQALGIVEVEDEGLVQGRRAAGAGDPGLGVARVALDLGGATLVGLDDQRDGAAADAGGGGVVLGHPGDEVLGGAGVGQDLLLGAANAAGERGHGDGGAHHPEEVPARGGVHRGGLDLFRELLVEGFLEGGGVLELLETPPVALVVAHRWHPEQWMGGLMLLSFLSWVPRASWSPPSGL